ncbi:hypothetical protein [Nocardia sp. NPDC004604]|uniref:hypothetical protein n=1 Tax=Nocardia sp. NPDC004604 TaxID=3157013 RepID=UPI0033A51568
MATESYCRRVVFRLANRDSLGSGCLGVGGALTGQQNQGRQTGQSASHSLVAIDPIDCRIDCLQRIGEATLGVFHVRAEPHHVGDLARVTIRLACVLQRRSNSRDRRSSATAAQQRSHPPHGQHLDDIVVW